MTKIPFSTVCQEQITQLVVSLQVYNCNSCNSHPNTARRGRRNRLWMWTLTHQRVVSTVCWQKGKTLINHYQWSDCVILERLRHHLQYWLQQHETWHDWCDETYYISSPWPSSGETKLIMSCHHDPTQVWRDYISSPWPNSGETKRITSCHHDPTQVWQDMSAHHDPIWV